MTFDHRLGRLLGGLVFSHCFVIGPIFSAPSIHYSNHMGEEHWRMSGNPLRCGLSLFIPDYGIGYFEQYATKAPHFILRQWDEVRRALPTHVLVKSPVWKPNGRAFEVAKTFLRPGAYGIFLSQKFTRQLLGYLSQGYEAQFSYHSDLGFDMTISLSPIRFQQAYSSYQKCLGGLLPFNYDAVRETVIHFGVDEMVLTDNDKKQLRRIHQYVSADSQIGLIKIEGYSDESGRKGYNNAISQYRAEAVYRYLLKLGVPQMKISVTWFGVLKPVARNDTDEGRAANRRVMIKLIKK